MTSKTLFNMNAQLKKAAMKKAHKEGWTLSAMLNFATRAYVEDRLSMQMLDPELAQALDDIEHGRVVSLEDVMKEIRSKRKSK